MRYYILICLLLASLRSYCNSAADNLKNKIDRETSIEGKSRLLWQLGIQYNNSQPDSAMWCYSQALALLKKLPDNEQQSTSAADIRGKLYRGMGIVYYMKSKIPEAISYYKKSLVESRHAADIEGILSAINNIGTANKVAGNYQSAFEYYIKGLQFAEAQKNKKMEASFNINVGGVFFLQKIYDKAAAYHHRALEIYEELGDKVGAANCYINLGCILQEKNGNADSIMYFYRRALPVCRQAKDYAILAIVHSNIGQIYQKQKKYSLSTQNFLNAIEYAKRIGNKQTEAYCYTCIMDLYADIYSVKKDSVSLRQMYRYASMALDISREVDAKYEQMNVLGAMAKYYSAKNDYKHALYYNDRYQALKDSLFNEDKSRILSQVESRFLINKKLQEIDLLKKDKSMQAVKSQIQLTIIVTSLIGIALLVLVIIFIYRRLKESHRQEAVIEGQKLQVEQQNRTLGQHNEEIRMQKEQIEQQQHSIIESINYAQRIQKAVLPAFPEIDILQEHFIFYKPKNIVSGDFFWFAQKDKYIVLAVGDCTGHGVPGGFLSMLGMSFLSEIVNREKIFDSSLILDRLRQRFIRALQQSEGHSSTKDGMDIALCVVDTESLTLQFSGAGNALYLKSSGKELQIIKGDLQPVGIYPRMMPFGSHNICLERGDTIYLSSDGFKDQFNEKRQKFGSSRFSELIARIAASPFEDQYSILERTFYDWKQGAIQVDDVTFMGVRF